MAAAILEPHANEIIASSASFSTSERFWQWRLRIPIMLAFLIVFFQALQGINAILYFASRIFAWTGMGDKAALLQSIGLGVTNLVFIFAGLALIDKVGRGTLLLLGSCGYIATLGMTAWVFMSGHCSIVPACIFAFIAAHAIGQGAVIWVFIAEIVPNRQRAEGQTLGSATHWVFAALLTTIFPMVVGAIEPMTTGPDKSAFGYIVLLFCGMMVLQLVWVAFMMSETKGVPLEDYAGKTRHHLIATVAGTGSPGRCLHPDVQQCAVAPRQNEPGRPASSRIDPIDHRREHFSGPSGMTM